MAQWQKTQIQRDSGMIAEAQAPVIISASRSTDIPAFYADWFFHRLKVGYSAWTNPFNGVRSFVSYEKCRFIVFWSKNPKPLLGHLDELEERKIGCYIQYTLNDYEKEGLEKGVPSLEKRIDTFKRLVDQLGQGRVIWRFDPLILTDKISMEELLRKVENIGDQLNGYTEKLVFSYADIKTYSVMNGDKLEKARWQLSIYAYLFELQNKKAKVDSLYVIHLRDKEKRNGERSVITKLIPVARIPSEVCKDLLEADLRGDQFKNPYSIPDDIKQLEAHIRELVAEKTKAETELDLLKSEIMKRMTDDDIRQWYTETMKITRKLPSVRTSFNLALFKQDHPDLDYSPYMKESEVKGSLLITI